MNGQTINKKKEDKLSPNFINELHHFRIKRHSEKAFKERGQKVKSLNLASVT